MGNEEYRRRTDEDVAVIKNELKHVVKALDEFSKVIGTVDRALTELPCKAQNQSIKNLWIMFTIQFTAVSTTVLGGYFYLLQKLPDIILRITSG